MQTWTDRIVGWALAACLGAMTIIVFVAVIYRYVLDNPLDWTGELASLLFAWITFVGAFVGMRSRSHIKIDTLTIFLSARVRRGLKQVIDLGLLLMLALFIWQGTSLTITTWSLEYPAMEISRGCLYASLPVGGLLMTIALVQGWWREWRGRGERRP